MNYPEQSAAGEPDDDALIEQYDPNREQPEGRPIYTIMLTVTGSRLESTLKKAHGAFGDNPECRKGQQDF
jgi:hypothetical protein